MMTVNIHEAKTNLSKLISFLEKGEDIIIARAGSPVAKLVSYTPSKEKRTANMLKGKVSFYEDFNSSDDEIATLFNGKY
ncbi:MAG: type II toxin-antitoxin system Phd/YefM family antitoxin [Sulfurovum sp.]|nr:type II toxin-antitoxin system Phd/YefM family antitoxin [Sulfurovum sp.]